MSAHKTLVKLCVSCRIIELYLTTSCPSKQDLISMSRGQCALMPLSSRPWNGMHSLFMIPYTIAGFQYAGPRLVAVACTSCLLNIIKIPSSNAKWIHFKRESKRLFQILFFFPSQSLFKNVELKSLLCLQSNLKTATHKLCYFIFYVSWI